MERREIVALLEALCDRPLGAGEANDPATVQALCRRAAELLARTQDGTASAETVADPDRLAALLATVLSGRASEAERARLAETLAHSPAYRLEAASAAAYVDAIEAAAQPAPAALIDKLLAGSAVNKPTSSSVRPSRLSAPTPAKWLPNWRTAAAFAALLIVAGGAWSLYWQQGIGDQPLPAAEPTTLPAPAVPDAAPALPVTPMPAAPPRAAAHSCGPHEPPSTAKAAQGGGQPVPSAKSSDDANCVSSPDSELAGRPDDRDLAAARARAEAERSRLEAAKAGATQTGRASRDEAQQADKALQPAPDPAGQRPAAARAAPSPAGVR